MQESVRLELETSGAVPTVRAGKVLSPVAATLPRLIGQAAISALPSPFTPVPWLVHRPFQLFPMLPSVSMRPIQKSRMAPWRSMRAFGNFGMAPWSSI